MATVISILILNLLERKKRQNPLSNTEYKYQEKILDYLQKYSQISKFILTNIKLFKIWVKQHGFLEHVKALVT